MTQRVAVVGSANADLVVAVDRRPSGGETLMGGELSIIPGGKGANQAVAAGLAGAVTSFVGCVGNDGNGEILRASLTRAGVSTRSLHATQSPTGTAIIFLTPDGENSIVVSPGANHDLTRALAERECATWREAAAVVLSLEIPLETVRFVIADAAEHGTRVIVNAAPATSLGRDVLEHCDPLIVNEHEALEVLGATGDDPDASDYPALATRLLEAGAHSVIVTLGAEGALIATGAGCEAMPAFSVRATDTTGAGDAFVGAVAAELSRGADLSEAVRFAQAMSALSVQRLGAQTSYENEQVVRAFLVENA